MVGAVPISLSLTFATAVTYFNVEVQGEGVRYDSAAGATGTAAAAVTRDRRSSIGCWHNRHPTNTVSLPFGTRDLGPQEEANGGAETYV